MSQFVSLDPKKFINYFLVSVKVLPPFYIELETNHLMVVYFIIVALDLLSALHEIDRELFLQDIYAYQLEPGSGSFGFHGYSLANVCSASSGCSKSSPSVIFQGNLAMIYTALASLITLEDDFQRLQIEPIIDGLSQMQLSNGAFKSSSLDTEGDVRYTYCALAVRKLLGIVLTKKKELGTLSETDEQLLSQRLSEAINEEMAIQFLLSTQSWEGGFGIVPGGEAQGGATYCAVASLVMLGAKNHSSWTRKAVDWCINR